MAQEFSYGIIPLQKQAGAWYVLLIQHGTAGYWGFPKGHTEQGETPKETAVRELKEETGLDVVRFLSEDMQEMRYHFTKRGRPIEKHVGLFIAEVKGDLFLQVGEILNARWVSLSAAEQSVTYATDKAACREAQGAVISMGQET